jgi:hypothetical protein
VRCAGRTRDEVVGVDLFELFPPTNRSKAEVIGGFAGVIKNQAEFTIDMVNRLEDGRSQLLSATMRWVGAASSLWAAGRSAAQRL